MSNSFFKKQTFLDIETIFYDLGLYYFLFYFSLKGIDWEKAYRLGIIWHNFHVFLIIAVIDHHN